MSNTPSEQPGDPLAGLNPENLLKQGLASDSGNAPTEDRAARGQFVPPTAEELNAILPQFEILELVGRGGMGAVYKARQSALDRVVAIKILPPQVGRDSAFAERFSREAKALAKLSHPNIVAIHDAGSVALPNSPDKLYFFVMEFVDGVSLRHVIHEGKLPPEDALAIVPQVCEALQYAHDEGIVHRDIKPDNILLDTRGRVKIADFGLAKLLGQDAAEVTLTGTHQVMGTLRYMAPEQMEGSKAIDHRADIYSLGVVFYELLTGDVPMGRFAAPSKKVQIDVRLDEIVLRALEQEPDKRFQQASEVKTELEAVRLSSSKLASLNRQLTRHELEERVLALLPDKKIDAIRLFMETTGKPLAESKVAVETMAKLHAVFDPKRHQRSLVHHILLVCITILSLPWLLRGSVLSDSWVFAIWFSVAVLGVAYIFFLARLHDSFNKKLAQAGKVNSAGGSGRNAESSRVGPPAWWLGVSACCTLLLAAQIATFGGAFLDSLRGFDGRLVELGKTWGLGATTESAQAAVVLSGLTLLGLAVAGWSFWIYHYSLAIAARTVDVHERAHILVRGPAIGLILMGVITIPFNMLIFIAGYGEHFFGAGPIRAWDCFILFGHLYWGYMAVGLIGGGMKMLELKSIEEARAVARMSLYWPILNLFAFVPISLWALAVLGRRDLEEAFTNPTDPKPVPVPPVSLETPSVKETNAIAPVSQLKPFSQMGLGEAARQLFLPEELDKPGITPWTKWGRVGTIVVAMLATQFLLSGMKLSIFVTCLLVVPMLVLMGIIAVKHRGERRGRQALFVIGTLGVMVIGIPLIVVLSNPQPTLDWLARNTGMEPGADDALVIQTMFLFLVVATLLGLVGYWLKLRNSRWQKAWMTTSSIAMFAAILVAAVMFSLNRGKTTVHPVWGETGFVESSRGIEMGRPMLEKLGIPPQQVAAANEIFRDYLKKYTALERRHTTQTTDANGHIHITIEPFVDEMFALSTDLHKELSGIVDQRIAPPAPMKGMVHASLPIFRQAGEALLTVEMWKTDDGQYHWKQDAKWVNGGSSSTGYSGRDARIFPQEYRLYWSEGEASVASNSEAVFAAIRDDKAQLLSSDSISFGNGRTLRGPCRAGSVNSVPLAAQREIQGRSTR